jgi:DNA adenine methylase
MICKPFLKWAGGKTQLLSSLASKLPPSIGTYYEPMLGGGALFFSLNSTNAHLSDINSELVNAYIVVRDSVEELIAALSGYLKTREFYYNIRNQDRDVNFTQMSSVDRAARFIYLNKTCFNGLYRVNADGHFNVPMGTAKTAIFIAENLRECSRKLSGKLITVSSFNDIEVLLRSDDFVYLDPPYLPLTDTAKFTEYTASGFSLSKHEELADFCRRISNAGIKFMLSNAHTDKSMELYSGFHIEVVPARRSISAKNSGRARVSEIIVTNY